MTNRATSTANRPGRRGASAHRTTLIVLLLLASGALHAFVATSMGSWLPGRAEPTTSDATLMATVQVTQVQPHQDASLAPAEELDREATPTDSQTPKRDNQGIRYYEVSEVDTPATPQPDWFIDAEGLSVAGVQRLVAHVYVGSDGVPRKCSIVAMEPALRDTWPAVETALCRTRLVPAMRRGAAVANVRRIELVLAN